MIDEPVVVRACEKEMTTPFEPGLLFRKIHVQRLDDGWYAVCMIYKVLHRRYDTTEAYERMRRKLTIIGEFIVDDVGEIRRVDYCRDVPLVDVFGDHQFEYTKSKKLLNYVDRTLHRCLN